MEAVLSIEEILDEIRDLTSKEMTSESKNRVIKLGKNLLEVGIFALMNRGSNFYGTLLSNTNKNSTLALQAPAAVSHDKTSSRFYIHINPLLMANLCTKPSEVIAIIEHEAYHLMNMHLVIYSNMMKKGEKSRNRMNIGTDCYINQKIDNIPDGCVTVDTVREIALLKEDEIQENRESSYYIKLLEDNERNEENMMFKFSEILQEMQNQKQNKEDGKEEENEANQDLIDKLDKLIEDLKDDLMNNDDNELDDKVQDSAQEVQNELDQNGKGTQSEQEFTDSNEEMNNNPSRPSKLDTLDKAEKLRKDERMKQIAQELCDSGNFGMKPGETLNPDHDEWNSQGGYSDDPSMEGLKKDLHDILEKTASRSRGTMPAEYKEVIEKLKKPAKISWKKILKTKVGKVRKGKKKTILRFNRRQPFRNDLRGTLPGTRLGKIIVAVDTSGSMSSQALAEVLNEVYHIVKNEKIECEVIYFDSDISKVVDIKDANKMKFEIYGRGGTSFQPVFDYLEKQYKEERKYNKKEDMVVFFTDGYGEYEIETYGFNDLIWIIMEQGQLSVNDHKGIVIEMPK